MTEFGPHWTPVGDAIFPADGGVRTLAPGIYRAAASPRGVFLMPMTVATDALIPLPDAPMERVLKEIKQFWPLKPKFEQRGLLHKRGALLYGPPGSGKTATIALLAKETQKEGGISIHLNSASVGGNILGSIRKIEPERPIVCFIEDIDQGDPDDYLSLLDGHYQINSVVYIATTNYPEELPPTLLDRPSRFDIVMEIGMPTAEARAAYLKFIEPTLTENELRDWVRKTPEYSIAYLRELVVLCRCYEKPLDEAIKRLDMQKKNAKTLDILRKAAQAAQR